MTADSMEEKVREFARLAQHRSEQQDKDVKDVVHEMTHDSYLMKHTTGDVLRELQERTTPTPTRSTMGLRMNT